MVSPSHARRSMHTHVHTPIDKTHTHPTSLHTLSTGGRYILTTGSGQYAMDAQKAG